MEYNYEDEMDFNYMDNDYASFMPNTVSEKQESKEVKEDALVSVWQAFQMEEEAEYTIREEIEESLSI